MSGQPSIICGEGYRFTLLTPQLVRMEYAPDGVFEDRPTQTVQNRAFPPVEHQLWRRADGIEIRTACMNIFYDEKPFSAHGLWIENRSECRGIYCTWHYGDLLTENLGGTTRTLDGADGAVPLENGILSRLQGYSVIDDSDAYALTEDGWIEPPRPGHRDLYFFSYGYAYRQALADFFHLCGRTPLLPRYALGNWWSRFHAYTDNEYLALMDRFEQAGIPISVAVLDMNWHISTDGADHKGWTGYTWDRALFPNPRAFLDALHKRGCKVTLNLHPAEGIQPHEAAYPQAAAALGKDARRGQRIPFEPSNPAFLQAYFETLHHPLEKDGVDFWWVDWQQGGLCSAAGMDPLWLLNHYHMRDAARNGKRPLILSRYAGRGGHRYPVGFSGDSVISWASLQFQPYFTATASNIGYGWWSHDIGGHMHGKRDDELQTRWLQFGVFSPIMRLHSTSNPFNGKEPWRYGTEVCAIMTAFLRLRQRMIPYLYSMNWRCHRHGEPLIQPMYYAYPREDAAYRVPNQYFFGSELMVMPITTPMSAALKLGAVDAWLPEGLYHDIFTGVAYRGGGMMRLSRPLETIPVLAKAGAIVPLMPAETRDAIPDHLEIYVFAGADGAFELYEDDGETDRFGEGEYLLTSLRLTYRAQGGAEFVLAPVNDAQALRRQRRLTVTFCGVKRPSGWQACCGDAPLEAQTRYDDKKHRFSILLPALGNTHGVTICLTDGMTLAENERAACWQEILNRAQIDYELKERIFELLCSGKELLTLLRELQAMRVPDGLAEALLEVL
ncbi:MAG: glycoside hydrolase family 31 protein [Clostridiales bacterium]|nr:glycoside hydrolase family 31 protein [Clostridiales bacterium]MDO4349452.1 glycoside hydrolase family 31 protein [Eubacteriales bacterium]MDY4008598.1 glycoside hydrolase family 31 protein [Candidatus Limiplasma sp.]